MTLKTIIRDKLEEALANSELFVVDMSMKDEIELSGPYKNKQAVNNFSGAKSFFVRLSNMPANLQRRVKKDMETNKSVLLIISKDEADHLLSLSEQNINETAEFRKELIMRAVANYAYGNDNIRGVSVEKIIDEFASKKNYGAKSVSELETSLDLPVGVIKNIAKEVQAELKANYSVSTTSMTQSQRVGRYLKQKHVK